MHHYFFHDGKCAYVCICIYACMKMAYMTHMHRLSWYFVRKDAGGRGREDEEKKREEPDNSLITFLAHIEYEERDVKRWILLVSEVTFFFYMFFASVLQLFRLGSWDRHIYIFATCIVKCKHFENVYCHRYFHCFSVFPLVTSHV